MKKTIVAFGDSNTHGYCSQTGGRFSEEERWTCLLEQYLGNEYRVMEEGLSGRTTVFDDPLFEGLNGLSAITQCLLTHEPVDLLLIAPAPIEEGYASTSAANEMGPGCVEKSRQLAFWYEDLAKRIGCSFLDAGAIDGIRMHPNDYMHLDKKSHELLARALAELIPSII